MTFVKRVGFEAALYFAVGIAIGVLKVLGRFIVRRTQLVFSR